MFCFPLPFWWTQFGYFWMLIFFLMEEDLFDIWVLFPLYFCISLILSQVTEKAPNSEFFLLLDVGFSHWFFTCLDTQNLQSKNKGNMAHLRKVLSRFWFKLLLCYSHPLSSVQSKPWSIRIAPFNSSFSKDSPTTDAEQSNTTSLLKGDTNSYEHISSKFSQFVWQIVQ